MNRKIETYGSIDENGILKISYRQQFIENLKLFAGTRIRLIVEKLYKKRSNEQNAYYHGVIVNCCIQGIKAEWGENKTHQEAHEMLKQYCNYKERVNNSTGEIIHETLSTKDLTTSEFMDFVANCKVWIYEWLHIDVPEPGEQSELELKID
jgi:hypothetical protein